MYLLSYKSPFKGIKGRPQNPLKNIVFCDIFIWISPSKKASEDNICLNLNYSNNILLCNMFLKYYIKIKEVILFLVCLLVSSLMIHNHTFYLIQWVYIKGLYYLVLANELLEKIAKYDDHTLLA